MIDAALPYLRCPVCERPLVRAGRALRCPDGHSFDMAKQGYADLTAGKMPHTGDTAAMVADRAAFLDAGHYDFIADALADTASAPAGRLVVDAGTGTGHYLARVIAGGAAGLGLDVSKPALRRAAKVAAAVLADLWRPLPLADGCADVVLNVFAPRNAPEFRRVLRPGGRLLVVTPTPAHLGELIAEHGLITVDADKEERVRAKLGEHFRAVAKVPLQRRLQLTGDEVRVLVGMTPSARHVRELEGLTGSTVTASVELATYVPF
jgi:23S rRNA (guanine745-N1)-methyltransferase